LKVTFAVLLCRIRAEYLEMPGFRITAPQAQRPWDPSSVALAVLALGP
jgi:hypothetical protein